MLLIQVDVKAFALFLALSLLSVRGVFPLRASDVHQNRLIIAGLRSAFCHQDDPAAGFSICLWRSKKSDFWSSEILFSDGRNLLPDWFFTRNDGDFGWRSLYDESSH